MNDVLGQKIDERLNEVMTKIPCCFLVRRWERDSLTPHDGEDPATISFGPPNEKCVVTFSSLTAAEELGFSATDGHKIARFPMRDTKAYINDWIAAGHKYYVIDPVQLSRPKPLSELLDYVSRNLPQ